jgi:hypothetical protein
MGPVSGRVNWFRRGCTRSTVVHPGEFRPSFESYLERIHPEDRARAAATVALALMDNRAFSMDERIVRPDGSLRQLRSHGEVVRDESGRPLKMVGACHRCHRPEGRRGRRCGALTRRLVAGRGDRAPPASRASCTTGWARTFRRSTSNLDILLGKLRDESARRRLDGLAGSSSTSTLQSIENVMADLRPALLDEYGPRPRIAWYGEEYAQRTGIRVAVQGEAGPACARRPAVACSG